MDEKKVALFLLAILLCIPGGTPVRAQADEEMTFVMAYPSDIGELNPMFYRSERSHWYDMLVYDTLISYDNDLEVIPWLAEDFAVTADGLSVTFTLRTGAVWHDGEPLTVDDVEFTFNYYKDAPTDAIAWSFMQHVSSVVVSGQNITVTLDQPFAFALQTLGELYILPEHIHFGIDADDARWNDEDNVTAHTGSGPFKFVKRVPDEYTELTRNDDWWGASNPHVGQLPNIETVRIDVVLGQDARILAMQAGTADSERYEVFGPYVGTVLNAPELDLVTGVVSQWDYVIGFNMTIPGFDDLQVRKAICYAINREQLVDIGRLGFGTPTNSSIPYEFFPEYYHEDGVFYEYDVATANQILEDAGYIDTDADGIREFPGGDPLEFDLWVLSWDDISVATGTGVRLQLAQIGIDISVKIKDDATMYEGIYEEPRAFSIYEMSHGYGSTPDHIWWRAHSSNIIDWGDNCYGLDNSTVDDILDDFMAATPAEMADAAKDAQVALKENIPYIPIFLSDDTHAIRKEWLNYTKKPGGVFTSFNPQTMIFMYDSGAVTTPPAGVDYVLLLGVGAGGLIIGVVFTWFIMKKKG